MPAPWRRNGEALEFIADRWLDAVKDLADASVAHGDLQQGNVMITPSNEIKLVDYDCMCVPALVGRRNLEVGVEPYQHPQRDAKTLLSLDLDHFSSMVIYVALRALSVEPQLWIKYIEQPGYDKLLFRREDFQSPLTSPLYHDLMRLNHPEVKELTEQLFALTRARIDQVPPLGQLVNSYAKVERLLVARQWDAAVQLLNRRGHFRDAPDHLQPLIREAYEYVCRQEAWAAFSRIPREASEPIDRQLVEAWNEVLFADFPPAEQERTRVGEARARVQIVDRLHHLAQQTTGAITLVGEQHLVETAAHLPEGYRYSLHERVERARQSLSALSRLEQAISDQTSEAAIMAAWQQVLKAKCHRWPARRGSARVALAQQRVQLLAALAKMPEDLPPDHRDARLLAIWKEDLLAECPEADPWREAHQQAVTRREVLENLSAAVAGRDEAAMVRWTRQTCRVGYPLPADWAEPIRTARAWARRIEALAVGIGKATAGGVLQTVRRGSGSPQRGAIRPLPGPAGRVDSRRDPPAGEAGTASGPRPAGPGAGQRAGGQFPRAVDVAGGKPGRPLRAGRLPGRADARRRSADG